MMRIPTLIALVQIKTASTQWEFWSKDRDLWYGQYKENCSNISKMEVTHFPRIVFSTPMRYVNGSDTRIPEVKYSPDYRLPEPPWVPLLPNFKEENRPYRFSPFYKQKVRFEKATNMDLTSFGCYCTTVFKRLTNLATCGILTSRHILTTATSTELVLKKYRKMKTLENILGLWYDTDEDLYNSSHYMSVSRIHYHPWYNMPDRVNRSHPLPCVYDLAVWATTYRFPGFKYPIGPPIPGKVSFCKRGGSTVSSPRLPPTPRAYEYLMVVGYQFIWSINRVPAPWYKYVVRVSLSYDQAISCPKTEWGWFICIPGEYYAKHGLDSGAALHIIYNRDMLGEGWIGMNSFSMKLRSLQILNYFTVLDTHRNLEFFYNAYMGRLPYQYLDNRFYNTQWRAPMLKCWHFIEYEYFHPNQNQTDQNIRLYRPYTVPGADYLPFS